MKNKIEVLLCIIVILLIVNSIYEICKKIPDKPSLSNCKSFDISHLLYDTIYAQSSSIFSLAVYPDSVDFGDMYCNTTKSNFPSGGIICRVLTQYEDDWGLKIHVTQALTSGSNTIPLAPNFQFCSYGGTGDHPDAENDNLCPTYSTLTTTATKFYDAHDNESPNYATGTNITTKLKLTIPNNQKPGYYFTTIIFTLTISI